ncbi:MAG: transcription termination factor NusA [Candidatus Paceibacterota bacterium]|jgi:N utilization substance protein A
MFDVKALTKAIEQLAGEKDLDASQVKDAVEMALASAYKKEFEKRGEIIRCVLDAARGDAQFYQVKTVVDETTVRFPVEGEDEEIGTLTDASSQEEGAEPVLPLYNEERHILLSDARAIQKNATVDEELLFDLPAPSADFGRIAAQTAKQVILQKLREIEKDAVKKEFESKVGELVSGMVQRVERGNVYIDLGRASGIMFFSESIPGEHYRIGERLKFFLVSVQEGGRNPNLLLSRSHPRFVSKLFEVEVPEIADRIVEIKGVAREPGSRTKIAVASNADGVDPVGACVGQRGARVMAVNTELGNERIDIIEWSSDPVKFVEAAMSPAQPSSVEIIDERKALVLVPEDQLSLAIGRGGQNVRLAARLTGWNIDVRSQSNPDQAQEGGVSQTALGGDAASAAGEEQS